MVQWTAGGGPSDWWRFFFDRTRPSAHPPAPHPPAAQAQVVDAPLDKRRESPPHLQQVQCIFFWLVPSSCRDRLSDCRFFGLTSKADRVLARVTEVVGSWEAGGGMAFFSLSWVASADSTSSKVRGFEIGCWITGGEGWVIAAIGAVIQPGMTSAQKVSISEWDSRVKIDLSTISLASAGVTTGDTVGDLRGLRCRGILLDRQPMTASIDKPFHTRSV